jgi:DNA-directed RNA polymerase subunit alpha
MRVRWRDFELPSSVVVEAATRTREYAKFVIEPFERGFGATVGNSLRRVLLSSLEGAALYSVRIEGVAHEFTGIPGVYEDVTDIVLRLKQVRIVIHEGDEVELRIEKDKKGQITGGDIQCPSNAEILNPDLVIATLTDDVRFSARLAARRGRGYVTAVEIAKGEEELGLVFLDAAFSPVARVRYTTEDTRVGQKTNYDRLVLEVWTNGVVDPELALVEAAKILRKHLNPFVQYQSMGALKQPIQAAVEEPPAPAAELVAPAPDLSDLAERLARPVADLNLTVRAANCLESQNIQTVGDLVRMGESELLKVENLGRTTLGEIKRRLDEWGLRLGMETAAPAGTVQP